MKAYVIHDRGGYSDYSVVVFAESHGKAKAAALGTDEFPSSDWDYTELSARRLPALDKYYHGQWMMDWDNMEERLALVKEAGFRCDPDYAELDDCKDCKAKEWCGTYESMMEDAKEEW